MKRMMAAACAVLVLATGCGGGDDEDGQAAVEPGSTAPAASGGSAEREKALKIAAQGYVDALLSNDPAGIIGYLDPETCTDEHEGNAVVAAAMLSKAAGGARMTITEVTVAGDRGAPTDYKLSDGAPDSFRRLAKSMLAEGTGEAWKWRDGEWYLVRPCLDESTPTP